MLRLLPYLIAVLVIIFSLRTFDIFNDKSFGDFFKNLFTSAENTEELAASIIKEKEISDSNIKVKKENKGFNDSPPVIDDVMDESWITERNYCESVLTKGEFSMAEIEALQNLRKRRKEIKDKEEWLDLKAEMIQTLILNLEQKMNDLQVLQKEVKIILDEYNTKEEDKRKSLVKIYENMKPQNAARIFEELKINILLEVAIGMREVKLASIVAEMKKDKARDLTVALVNYRRMETR